MNMTYAPLSDRELLGRLIGVRAASKVYQGSLAGLFSGHAQHEKCAVARELLMRSLSEGMRQGSTLTAPDAVKDFLRLHFTQREYESFVVLYLDAQHRLINVEELFRGTLTQTSVYPREVVKASLRHNAAAVILSHNHPSGDTTPSRADEHLTQTLKQALALVDVRVLDHVIIAGSASLSFAERGLL